MIKNNKRILFSAYSLDVGGIETALVTLVNYLAKENYDITLVLEKKRGIFLDKLDKKIKIIEYSPSYFRVKLVSKCINMFKRLKFIFLYGNKFQFACSYATYSKMASFVARTASANNLLWVHNNYYDFFDKDDKNFRQFFSGINADKFKNIAFVSNEAKQFYIEKNVKYSGNIYVCNNLVDYEEICKLADEEVNLTRQDDVVTFLNVGRHDEHQKKLSRLLNVAKKLADEDENFRIILVGDGESTEEYRKFVIENGLDERVIFVGKTKNPYPYYKISDCVILTSDFEGYPVVYIESKTLNKPIITTDVSDSISDIDDKYGLVTKKDCDDIYNAMKYFIKYGFSIKEDFDPVQYNNNIIKMVKDIIENKV